ncbi:Ig-like domain-containing protein [Halioxenophilus sp. WMMB6]|uniref:Ig-like domain-containing protein n=1 Tax=Halioxenophilus sp. WMMB6 TaxID=3073815 RepID=UPI00295F433F|nr:Ig-like domain-containing protein [Halioxenophilus sp. WMMB6]
MISKSIPELGRLTVIEVLGDYIIGIPEKPSSPDGADYLVRAVDISDPKNPVTVATFGETAHPVLAHGTYKRLNEVYIGGGRTSDNAIRLNEDGSLSKVNWSAYTTTNYGKAAGNYPWAAKHWWSYDDVSGNAQLFYKDEVMAEWDHLGLTGVIGFPTIVGNILLYGSDQSFSGAAAYDISDPHNPVLLDVLKLPAGHPTLKDSRTGEPLQYGLGGYWYEVTGHYMVFARRLDNPGIQVVDFSDPTNLKLHCEVLFNDPASGLSSSGVDNPMYVNFQDEYAFAEQLKINVETCEVALQFDEQKYGAETSQYSRPIGNLMLAGGGHNYLLENQGIKSGGLSIWGHQAEPDTRPPYVSYHIPKADQTNYPVGAPISIMIPETLHATTIIPGDTLTVTEVGGAEVTVDYVLTHAGLMTVAPLNDFKPNTTYEVHLEGIEDAVHNKMLPYSFRFSTGSSVEQSPPTIQSVAIAPGSTLLVDESVTVTVNATDPEGDAMEYRFRASEGDEYGEWSSSNSSVMSYSETGTYRINVQVRDSNGALVTEVENVVVTDVLYPDEPSLASGPMALATGGSFTWVVNPDNDTVSRVSTSTHNLQSEFSVGANPFSVAVDAGNLAWITLRDEDAIAILDRPGNRVDTINLPYGSGPTGIVTDRERSVMYVALYNSGKVLKFDVATRTQIGEIDGLTTPYALALTDASDKLLATRFISPQNWGEVYAINTNNMTLASTIRLDKNMVPDDIDQGRGVPNYLSSIIIDANDQFAYVVGKKDNVGRGLLNGNADIDDDNTVRTFIAQINLAGNTENRSERLDFDNADSPSALAIASNGLYVFAALQGNNQIAVFSRDPSNGTLGGVVSKITAGLAPRGLLFDSATEQLFVKNYTERSVSTVDMSAFLSGNIVNPTINKTVTVSSEKLSAQVLKGKQLFFNSVYGLDEEGEVLARTSAEGYLSCATCHIDGGQDGRVYDFTGRGEGLRNNIALKGRSGTRFGNVHWSGNFDEIQDFENDIRLRFLGRGLMTDADFEASSDPQGPVKAGYSEDLDALAAYVSSLGKESLPRSPYRDSIGELTSAALQGQQVFIDLGCDSCHRGKAFTDGIRHDVGTMREYSGHRLGGELDGISTPSLLGVFESAPYLHDGSAETLDAVFAILGGEVFQAEEASLSGATIIDTGEFSYLRHGSGVMLSEGGSVSVTTSATAHNGAVRVRYGSVAFATDMTVTVNGTAYTRPLQVLPTVDGENVSFTEAVFTVALADGNNTISVSITPSDAGQTVAIDDITVSTAATADTGSAHTVFQSASASDKENLMAYLLQIDKASAPADDEEIVLGASDGSGTGTGGTGGGTGGGTNNETTDNPGTSVEPTQEETIDGGSLSASEDGGSGANGPFWLLLMALTAVAARRRNRKA